MKKSLLLPCGVLACLLLCSVSTSRADEYDDMRQKWHQALTGGSSYNPSDPVIASIIDRIDADADRYLNGDDSDPDNVIPAMLTTGGNERDYLWSDLASPCISSHITSSYTRLKALTLAYSTHGSSFEGDSTLLAHIKGG